VFIVRVLQIRADTRSRKGVVNVLETTVSGGAELRWIEAELDGVRWRYVMMVADGNHFSPGVQSRFTN